MVGAHQLDAVLLWMLRCETSTIFDAIESGVGVRSGSIYICAGQKRRENRAVLAVSMVESSGAPR